MVTIAQHDRFFLKLPDSPLIIFKGELIDFTQPKIEFNSLESMASYIEKFLDFPDLENMLESYYATKKPDWDFFNYSLINNFKVNKIYTDIMKNNPLPMAILPSALVEASKNKYFIFREIYKIFFTKSPISIIDQLVVLAIKCDLPYEFQKILKNPF